MHNLYFVTLKSVFVNIKVFYKITIKLLKNDQ